MKILNTLLLAQAAPAQGGSSMIMWIGIIVIFVFMYFTMIRPQKKQQQARMKMMSELKKGDRVIMMGGLHGKIDSINDEDKTVVLDADGIYLTFSRAAVRQVLPANPATPAEIKSNEAHEEKVETKAAESEAANTAEKDSSEKQDTDK